MSQWTHIAGLIRIDSLYGMAIMPDLTDDVMRRALDGAPQGSEGGPTIEIKRTREYNSLNWGHAAIAADLRDYGDDPKDVPRIKDWFAAVLERMHQGKLIARAAVLQIDVEYGPTHVLIGTVVPKTGRAMVMEHKIDPPKEEDGAETLESPGTETR